MRAMVDFSHSAKIEGKSRDAVLPAARPSTLDLTRRSGRVYDRGQWLPVSSMISVGETVNRWRSQLTPVSLFVVESLGESPTARLQSLMGAPSELRFRNSTVGVVGNSGTGSPIVAVLAWAQIGNFVVVDPQRFAPSNLERMHGSEWKHLLLDEPSFKAELMRDLIHSINPRANVVPLVGNVLHSNVIDELLKCDFILGCTDSVHGRVALDEFARHYLVPVIDVGVRMDGADGLLTEQLVNVAAYHRHSPGSFTDNPIEWTSLVELSPKGDHFAIECLVHWQGVSVCLSLDHGVSLCPLRAAEV